MISEATIRAVKYPPEKIPDSWYGNVPLNAEVAAPVLDIRKIPTPHLLRLADIQLVANANIDLLIQYDKTRMRENTAAMLSALPGAWDLLATNLLRLNFFGVAAVANYTTHYGVWASKATVAQKLLYGLYLSPEEQELARKYGVADTVEKGLLPLPISEQIEREYHVVMEETHSRSVTITLANTNYDIEHLYPNPGEIVVLTRVAAAPGGAANIVRLHVDRDQTDIDYANVQTFPLSLLAGGEITCFIPALREIRLYATAVVAPGAHLFRYTFQRIKLNNILRARFGIASKDELPGDTYEKVLVGVL